MRKRRPKRSPFTKKAQEQSLNSFKPASSEPEQISLVNSGNAQQVQAEISSINEQFLKSTDFASFESEQMNYVNEVHPQMSEKVNQVKLDRVSNETLEQSITIPVKEHCNNKLGVTSLEIPISAEKIVKDYSQNQAHVFSVAIGHSSSKESDELDENLDSPRKCDDKSNRNYETKGHFESLDDTMNESVDGKEMCSGKTGSIQNEEFSSHNSEKVSNIASMIFTDLEGAVCKESIGTDNTNGASFNSHKPVAPDREQMSTATANKPDISDKSTTCDNADFKGIYTIDTRKVEEFSDVEQTESKTEETEGVPIVTMCKSDSIAVEENVLHWDNEVQTVDQNGETLDQNVQSEDKEVGTEDKNAHIEDHIQFNVLEENEKNKLVCQKEDIKVHPEHQTVQCVSLKEIAVKTDENEGISDEGISRDSNQSSPFRTTVIDFESKLPCSPDPQNPMLKNLESPQNPQTTVMSFLSPTVESLSKCTDSGCGPNSITTPQICIDNQLDTLCNTEERTFSLQVPFKAFGCSNNMTASPHLYFDNSYNCCNDSSTEALSRVKVTRPVDMDHRHEQAQVSEIEEKELSSTSNVAYTTVSDSHAEANERVLSDYVQAPNLETHYPECSKRQIRASESKPSKVHEDSIKVSSLFKNYETTLPVVYASGENSFDSSRNKILSLNKDNDGQGDTEVNQGVLYQQIGTSTFCNKAYRTADLSEMSTHLNIGDKNNQLHAACSEIVGAQSKMRNLTATDFVQNGMRDESFKQPDTLESQPVGSRQSCYRAFDADLRLEGHDFDCLIPGSRISENYNSTVCYNEAVRFCPCCETQDKIPAEQVFIHDSHMYQLSNAKIVCIGNCEIYSFLRDNTFFIPLGSFLNLVGQEIRSMFENVVKVDTLYLERLSPYEIILLEQRCNTYHGSKNEDLLDVVTLQAICALLLKINPENETLKMLAFSKPCVKVIDTNLICCCCGLYKKSKGENQTYLPFDQTGEDKHLVKATVGTLKIGTEEISSFSLNNKVYISLKDIVKHKVMSLNQMHRRMKKLKSKAIRAPLEIEAFFTTNAMHVGHTLWIDMMTLRCIICMSILGKKDSVLRSSIAWAEYSYDACCTIFCEKISDHGKIHAVNRKTGAFIEDFMPKKTINARMPFILDTRRPSVSGSDKINGTRTSRSNDSVSEKLEISVVENGSGKELQAAKIGSNCDPTCLQSKNVSKEECKIIEKERKPSWNLRPRKYKTNSPNVCGRRFNSISNLQNTHGKTKAAHEKLILEPGDYVVRNFDKFIDTLNAGRLIISQDNGCGFTQLQSEETQATALLQSEEEIEKFGNIDYLNVAPFTQSIEPCSGALRKETDKLAARTAASELQDHCNLASQIRPSDIEMETNENASSQNFVCSETDCLNNQETVDDKNDYFQKDRVSSKLGGRITENDEAMSIQDNILSENDSQQFIQNNIERKDNSIPANIDFEGLRQDELNTAETNEAISVQTLSETDSSELRTSSVTRNCYKSAKNNSETAQVGTDTGEEIDTCVSLSDSVHKRTPNNEISENACDGYDNVIKDGKHNVSKADDQTKANTVEIVPCFQPNNRAENLDVFMNSNVSTNKELESETTSKTSIDFTKNVADSRDEIKESSTSKETEACLIEHREISEHSDSFEHDMSNQRQVTPGCVTELKEVAGGDLTNETPATNLYNIAEGQNESITHGYEPVQHTENMDICKKNVSLKSCETLAGTVSENSALSELRKNEISRDVHSTSVFTVDNKDTEKKTRNSTNTKEYSDEKMNSLTDETVHDSDTNQTKELDENNKNKCEKTKPEQEEIVVDVQNSNRNSQKEMQSELEDNIRKYLVFTYIREGSKQVFKVKGFKEGAEKIFPVLFQPDPEHPPTRLRRIEFMKAAGKYMDDLFSCHKQKQLEVKSKIFDTDQTSATTFGKSDAIDNNTDRSLSDTKRGRWENEKKSLLNAHVMKSGKERINFVKKEQRSAYNIQSTNGNESSDEHLTGSYGKENFCGGGITTKHLPFMSEAKEDTLESKTRTRKGSNFVNLKRQKDGSKDDVDFKQNSDMIRQENNDRSDEVCNRQNSDGEESKSLDDERSHSKSRNFMKYAKKPSSVHRREKSRKRENKARNCKTTSKESKVENDSGLIKVCEIEMARECMLKRTRRQNILKEKVSKAEVYDSVGSSMFENNKDMCKRKMLTSFENNGSQAVHSKEHRKERVTKENMNDGYAEQSDIDFDIVKWSKINSACSGDEDVNLTRENEIPRKYIDDKKKGHGNCDIQLLKNSRSYEESFNVKNENIDRQIDSFTRKRGLRLTVKVNNRTTERKRSGLPDCYVRLKRIKLLDDAVSS